MTITVEETNAAAALSIHATLACLEILTAFDVVEARTQTRRYAQYLGFRVIDVHFLVTSASELCHNLIMHAGGGLFLLGFVQNQSDLRKGIQLATKDRGPGIADIKLALTEGYSTANSLGSGLPGVLRCCDELSIQPRTGGGTYVSAIKWLSS